MPVVFYAASAFPLRQEANPAMRLLRQVKIGRTGATLDEQLTLIWNNLRAILASADMSIDNIVRLTSYLRDASFVEANQNARLAPLVALGGRAIPTTAIVAQTLHDDWLVEIEVIAAA
jgi:enamine deaminase RidA (YjgF/YER057c/UK114 family)